MARASRENTNLSGLSSVEAEKQLAKYGENILSHKKSIHPAKIFAGQFKDFMVMILLGATVVSVLMGEAVEALTIVLIVLVNAVLGFLQEYRTEKTLEALKNMAAPTAKVVRDNREIEIPAAEVVPGDLLLLQAGDRVAADAQVVEAVLLQADESLLSGESHPVSKMEQPQNGTQDNFRKDMVYMGTTITKGRGKAAVVGTGMATQMGQIAGMLETIEAERTPLQEKLGILGKYIGIGCLLICAVVTATGIVRGEPVFDMLLTGISLAVAAIPEGLPAVVTIALALAVSRMVKRGALIRKLHAVETMGCAQVICTDKTGTLTENRMTVQEVATPRYHLYLEDTGRKNMRFLSDDGKVDPFGLPDVKKLIEIAVLCNNTHLAQGEKSSFRVKGPEPVPGDPTESALLVMAENARFSVPKIVREFSRTFEIPFDSQRKRMSVVVQSREGDRWLFSKGAPDYLLELCRYYLEDGTVKLLTPSIRKKIQTQNEEMAKKALRVLSFAYRPEPEESEQAETDLVFVGLAGMMDPPRQEAYQAVQTCKKAGIQTVMITGDHVVTATAIAEKLKILESGGRVLTGKELDEMTDAQLERELEQIRVFARVAPAHKLRVVKAFKKKGKVVAMTGDGVNDAPAIKEADIGVSMGNGTDVTKEASSVILLDNSFATLVSAIEEGRVIYKNIRKFIRYLLSCNIGEIVTMFFGMLMGMPVVLLPIQILIVNLVTDGLPAIALGLEPAEKDSMHRPPRKRQEGIFSDGLLSTILFRGILIGLTTLAVFTSFYHSSGDLTIARTGALAALVMTQLVHVFECKREEVGIFKINLLDNWKLVAAVVFSALVLALSIHLPICNRLFQTAPLSWGQIGTITAYCAAVPILSSVVIPLKNRLKREKSQEALPLQLPVREK
ncbi:MAG: cation-translocating P-type ATPase [Oscillospiraceae bacterium]|nr:cation-translocating P-type ATPase [Oscillospiraceae bacterium]